MSEHWKSKDAGDKSYMPRKRGSVVHRLLALLVLLSLIAFLAETSAMAGELLPAKANSTGVRNLAGLEKKIEQPEEANRLLAAENHTIQKDLAEQEAKIVALQQQLQASAVPVRELQEEMPLVRHQVATMEKNREHLPVSVGFRTGWAESPYDMPGGFFYGAFLNHRLLTQSDGIPHGEISGELMVGAIFGNHAMTNANLASQLGVVGPNSSWLTTVEIEPTVQYHLDLSSVGLASLEAIKPYVLAGPGMWISLMSTPVHVSKSVPGNGFRHSDADVQPGGVYGLGFDVQLGKLVSIPAIEGVLDKTAFGAEWRYNTMANGEQFQQYTGSLTFGW
jgi:hypothetical protein